MMLAEIKPRVKQVAVEVFDGVESYDLDHDIDVTALELFSDWKAAKGDRFGAGSPNPYIPRSQRQYDGDNHFEYCEPFAWR